MNRTLIALLALLSIGIGGAAFAQTAEPTPQTAEPVRTAQVADNTGAMSSTVTGTIVESTGTLLTIRTETGDQMTFSVDSSSRVLATLPADRRVTVKYDTTPSGTYHVMNVEAVAPAPATSSSYDDDMPQTASPLPLLGLIGVGALLLGGTIGLASRRPEPRS